MERNTDRSMEENHGNAIVGSSNPNLGVVSAETLSASETLRRYSLGYRFNPLDQELILGYLLRKIKGLSLPTNLMHEVDIYLHTPEHLTVNYEAQGDDKKWYFFTPRDRKYKNGRRPNRRAEDGYWKATGVIKTVKKDDGQEIGFRRTLVYYRGNAPKDVKTSWMMHEFKVNGPSLLNSSIKWKRDMLLDYVLCRIYQKDESKKRSQKKQKTEPVETDEEGNNSSAEEEANSSNDTTHSNADTDTANNNANGDINQSSNDNMTGHVEHTMNQPSNKAMIVYDFNELMNNTRTNYVKHKINQTSNNTMTSYGEHNDIGCNVSIRMQNCAPHSSSLSKLLNESDDDLVNWSSLMQALSSYQPGYDTHNFTAITDHQQQQPPQPPQQPAPPCFPSNKYNYPAAPS